ncbi:hypothetical protein KFE25_004414 [Diacronema lutheri]|uniref:Uncharacterized protein n=1 Tax=Diacronema lutheri TaxID=2081491 RepID=A0A8J5X0N5_DIALT|nr:hypothetical protein KFE25_004414 [Diacronema lutheri]
MEKLPVTVLSIGLLYSRKDLDVGQRGAVLNMADLSLLPLTPVMGNGMAPLQPLEVDDAAHRLAFLALTEPAARPMQRHAFGNEPWARGSWSRLIAMNQRHFTLRVYDAVGPETLSMLELMRSFARLNGRELRPVLVDYRNLERVLNVASLGNLNRQFVSLLRSEQDAEQPIVGNPSVFEKLLGPDARLVRLDDLPVRTGSRRRHFPYANTLRWALSNYGVIEPGLALGVEVVTAYLFGKQVGAPLCLAPSEIRAGVRRERWRRAALALAAGGAAAALLYGAFGSRLPPWLGGAAARRMHAQGTDDGGRWPRRAPADGPEPLQAVAGAVALRRRPSVRLLGRGTASSVPPAHDGGGVKPPRGPGAESADGGGTGEEGERDGHGRVARHRGGGAGTAPPPPPSAAEPASR